MKNLLLTIVLAIAVLGCNNAGNYEKRIADLEAANNQKDLQIYGLTQLAYSSFALAADIDSSENLVLPKEFETYNLQNTNICKAKCLTKLSIKMNICRHVAPQNRQTCENSAFAGYSNCIGHCN